MPTTVRKHKIVFEVSPNILPGGFSKITRQIVPEIRHIANDLAVALRAISNMTRIEGLLKKTPEGGASNPDLQSGRR